MNKKIVAVWISLAMVLSFIVIIIEIAPVVKAPTTWYVDDVPGGIPPEDFTSIQQAIDNASDWDTIHVLAGKYEENMVIDKKLTLIGEGRENVTINNTINDPTLQKTVVEITASWVTFRGFNIEDGGRGIEITGSNCQIESNTVRGSRWEGISNSDGSNNIIKDNIVENIVFGYGGNGIVSAYGSGNLIESNQVNDNAGLGIEIAGGTGNIVKKNVVSNNHYEGIAVSWGDGSVVENNVVIDNKGLGISARGGTNNIINNNTLINNSINIYDGIEVLNNTLNGQGVYYFDGISGTKNSPILIDGNAGMVILRDCHYFKIQNNIMDYGGVYLWSGSNIIIENNTITHNVEHGITLWGPNNTVIRNIISNNSVSGIHISGTEGGNIVENNTITYNGQYGIHITLDNFSNILTHNNIYYNLEYGVFSEADVDARYNWWGSEDGPSGSGGGSGDAVNDNVLYRPWLTVSWSEDLLDNLSAFIDSDGDGHLDDEDAFPNDPNEWKDSDNDTIGDSADPDDDNDGMPDYWEEKYGLNKIDPTDANKDADGDGFSNLEEHEAETDPTNVNDYPRAKEWKIWDYQWLIIIIVILIVIIVVGMMLLRKKLQPKEENNKEWTKCPKCNVRLKTINLDKHMKKAHKKK